VLKLSDYVIRFIANQGVKHLFLVTGGGAMHLNESLTRSPEIEPVCTLHEQASAIGAETYSKATNHLGVAMVTSGPGSTNAITGVAGAWFDSTPLLVVSGQVKRADLISSQTGIAAGVRQIGVQEIGIVPIVESITKYAVTVTDPQAIRYHLEKAMYLASSGRPGPVWIDIPLDVQASPIDPDSLRGFEISVAAAAPSALEDDVRRILERLRTAERPLLLAGNGIRMARAEREFRELVERLGVPLETTWLAIDFIEHAHPLFVGRPGPIAPRGANFAVQACDVLLAIGARMDRIITGYSPTDFARHAHKVMVDVDPSELAKMGDAVQHTVQADAGAFLREMLRQLRASAPMPDRAGWNARCAAWKTRYPVVLPEHRKPEGPVSVYHLSQILSEELRDGDQIVSGSSGSGIELFLLAFDVKRGQRIFHTSGLGAMGYGIAASVGACLGAGRKPIVCVDGDGGFQFNIQELETVSRLQLPIRFFVLNNNGYASIRASQTAFFGQPRIGCDARTGQSLPDVLAVAKAYGIATDVIRDQTNLREEVRRVLGHPGPLVCDVHVILDEVRQPRQVSKQRADGSFESTPIEDLWPFLDRDEFLSNTLVPGRSTDEG
jgi:acetolactate synthase I/II/III large subunit